MMDKRNTDEKRAPGSKPDLGQDTASREKRTDEKLGHMGEKRAASGGQKPKGTKDQSR
jgi:hypothetical protein